jgi:3-phenylpropionate/trans-cinnamate dioxygenase ferredoxin subunit
LSAPTVGNDWRRVASVTELRVKRRLVCTLDGADVLICHSGGELVAVQDVCTHLGKPLHEGRIMGGTITCPYHGACFDLRTGRAIAGPAVSPLRSYNVRSDGDDVYIEVQSKAAPI